MTKITLPAAIFLLIGLSFEAHSLGQDQRSELIKQLASDDPGQREEAFYKLRAVGVSQNDHELKEALLNLLEREGRLIDGKLKKYDAEIGVSLGFGEGYTPYIADLGDTIAKYADFSDRRTLSVFLSVPYHQSSRFESKLLNQGDAAASILIELSNHDIIYKRAEATDTLGVLLHRYRNRLSDEMVKLIKEALNQRLIDGNTFIRRISFNILERFRE